MEIFTQFSFFKMDFSPKSKNLSLEIFASSFFGKEL